MEERRGGDGALLPEDAAAGLAPRVPALRERCRGASELPGARAVPIGDKPSCWSSELAVGALPSLSSPRWLSRSCAEGPCATGREMGCLLNNAISWLLLTAALAKAVKNSLQGINLGLPWRKVR